MSVIDSKFEDEASGCTASVGLISHDKIYVVRLMKFSNRNGSQLTDSL